MGTMEKERGATRIKMEEDIKILEEFINNDFQKDKLERNEKGGFKIGTIYKTTELNPALENLIKGYRDSEDILKEAVEENLELKKDIRELEENKELKTTKGFEENIEVSKFGEWVGKNYIDYKFEYENYQRILADYIPKSKIKEKIEELEKENEQTYTKFLASDRANANLGTKGKMIEGAILVLQELMEDK